MHDLENVTIHLQRTQKGNYKFSVIGGFIDAQEKGRHTEVQTGERSTIFAAAEAAVDAVLRCRTSVPPPPPKRRSTKEKK